MTDVVIQVENLGKRYVLQHRQVRAAHYRTLRDTIAENTKSVAKKLLRRQSDQIKAHHDEFWALKEVSFEIKQGDRVGIVGHNGAGKSTLLKILSRITEPTQGRIEMQGRIASLLEVGTGFHAELTGRENIYLNGAILGMSRAEIARKFDEIVAFAEVERFLDTPVKRYSSGMYVRLAFAVAAHLEPEILIVDEVLAVGDARFQKKCLGKMENVAEQEGRTIIFVSHNMSAVRSLCSTGLLMNRGQLIRQGEIASIADEYLKAISDSKLRQSKTSGTRFIEVSVQDEAGTDLDYVEPETKTFLVFKIEVEDHRDLNLGFTLYKGDIPVLSSSTVETDEELSNGYSVLKIELPVQLLTTGEYRVQGAIWNPRGVIDSDEYLYSFNVYRHTALEAKGSKYKGILAFSSPWLQKTISHV